MKVGVYYPDNDSVHVAALLAFQDGVRSEPGDTVEFKPIEEYTAGAVDVAVVFGVEKAAVPYSQHRGRVLREQRKGGRHTIVIERGYVHRERHYAVGLNGLNGHADFANAQSPVDRWEKLGIKLAPWKLRARYSAPALIIGQVPHDASVQHIDFINWVSKQILDVQHNSRLGDPIFRPHPLAKDITPAFMGVENSELALAQDLARAGCVITYNSNVGVDAAIAGVPVVAQGRGSMIWGRAPRTLHELCEDGGAWNRKQWAQDLAYAQWTLDEMSYGAAWGHIRPALERSK